MEVTKHESTKLCQLFGSEPDLKMHVQKLGIPSPKRGPHYCLFSDRLTNIATYAQTDISGMKRAIGKWRKEFLTAVCPLRFPKFCEFCPQMANANCSMACGAQGWPSDCR